jgi:hypothetical protein
MVKEVERTYVWENEAIPWGPGKFIKLKYPGTCTLQP